MLFKGRFGDGKVIYYMSVITQASRRASYEAPPRSLIQRMEALDKANEIRGYRAQLKRDLKSGRANVLDVLLEPPEMLDTMKIFDLLISTPKRGRIKVNQLLGQCRISPSKRIGGLSQRQRSELVSMLRSR